jgi:hypothetical protein
MQTSLALIVLSALLIVCMTVLILFGHNSELQIFGLVLSTIIAALVGTIGVARISNTAYTNGKPAEPDQSQEQNITVNKGKNDA